MAPTYEDRNAIVLLMGFSSYQDYLQSKLWDGIRRNVLHMKGCRCHICGATNKQLDLHHVQYTRENLAGKSIRGIFPLCYSCHHEVEFDGETKVSLAKAVERFNNLFRKHNSYLSPKKKPSALHVRKVPKPTEKLPQIRCQCGNMARRGEVQCKLCKLRAIHRPSKTIKREPFIPHPASLCAIEADRHQKRIEARAQRCHKQTRNQAEKAAGRSKSGTRKLGRLVLQGSRPGDTGP